MHDKRQAQFGGSPTLLVTVVAVTALAARAAHLFFVAQADWWGVLQGDARTYVEWAGQIAGGDWLGGEGFYQAPLYPYVLAAIQLIFGAGIWPAVICQALAGTVTAVLVGVAARCLCGQRTGLVAGILMAAYGPGIYFDGIIQKASLAGLATSFVLFIAANRDNPVRNWRYLFIGLSVALLCLLREHAFVWVPLCLLWCYKRGHHGRTMTQWLAPVMCLLGLTSVLLPVGLRNSSITGSWSLSTFQAGPNFYIGNHEGADGHYVPLVRGHETPEFERRDATDLAQRAVGRRLTARQVSSYWMGRAIRDILDEPLRWATLMAAKVAMVWNRYEIPDVESQYVVDDSSPILRVLGSVWHFGILCPLAAVGVIATRRDWRRLWLYYTMTLSLAGAVALTFVSARYRYPLAPLLMLFAAAGTVDLLDRLRRRELRLLAGRAGLAIGVAFATNLPVQDEDRLTALSYMNLGVAMAKTGDLPAATDYFQYAVTRYPSSAEANNNLAQALALQGSYEMAIPHYRAALAVESSLPGAQYNLAVALEQTGKTADALSHYRMALDQNPQDREARAAVERLSGISP